LLDEAGTERTHNKPINVVTREIDTVERMKESLISNKDKKEKIIENQKIIAEKIKKLEEEHENVKKVYEVKDRYAKLVAEREKEYEISLKLFEKEKEEKVEVQKKTKYSLIILITAVLAIISIILIYFNLQLFAFIPAGAIIVSTLLINKFFSMEVRIIFILFWIFFTII
jgi:Flp pilus assembly protein TadB